MIFGVCTPPCVRKLCIWWATKCLISGAFLIYFLGGVACKCLPCLRKFCIWWATKALISRPFLIKVYMLFGGVACFLAYENLQSDYFLRFFPTDMGDFTCLAGFFARIRDILHALRESGRNCVRAGDSLSIRKSWKPCRGTLEQEQQFVLSGQMYLPCLSFTEHSNNVNQFTGDRPTILNVANSCYQASDRLTAFLCYEPLIEMIITQNGIL